MLNTFSLRVVLWITMVFLLTACSSTQILDKDFDQSNQPITVIVITYPGEKELAESYWKFLGKELKDDKVIKGYSIWSRQGDTNLTCEIHVINPSNADDDDRMETWGHELVHCVYGRFHK